MCIDTSANSEGKSLNCAPMAVKITYVGAFLPVFLWPIILSCLIILSCQFIFGISQDPSMCVQAFLSQDEFYRKGLWVEHPLTSIPL